MNNSYQQACNLDGAFCKSSQIRSTPGAVFLVDDVVDSRWTLTIIAALLRRTGSGRGFAFSFGIKLSIGLDNILILLSNSLLF